MKRSFTVYYFDIQTFCIKLYKVYNNLSQIIFSELFIRNNISYNSCSQSVFAILQIEVVYKGSNSLYPYRWICKNSSMIIFQKH